MTKLKSKPTGINPIQQAMIFENHAKTVRCDQVFRELVKNSLEEQVAELKQKMVVINQELDRILTIKQLENGRQKLHC